ncbi:MAG: hypothetical protein IJ359_08400 [Erysipelotrichaceae bacterium]|nr:hypothetical protein [Erysipelotrichaceae bacterium]
MEDKKVIEIEITGIEEASIKAARLVELLKEAKSLANEIATIEYEIIDGVQV